MSGDGLVGLCHAGPGGQLQRREPQADEQMVVGCRAAISHLATPQAAMHDHLLAIAPKCGADRFHETSALVLAVTRLPIDMLRIEAEGTMVAMSPAADRRPDKGLAMPAFELFGLRLPGRTSPVGPAVRAFRCRAATPPRFIVAIF